jgi:predicted peptidase
VGLGLAGTFLLALTACSGGGAKPSSQRMTMRPLGTAVGAPTGYWEYLPPGYGDGAKRPLLLALHGAGGDGDGTRASLPELLDAGIPKLIEGDEWPAARPFIVLMPQHLDAGSAECFGPQEIAGFLRYAMRRYDVDSHRVYLTGLSCSATGGWDYLALHADRVLAGAVLIAGNGGDAFARAGCSLGKVPIWAIAGSEDTTVDPTAGTVVPMRRLDRCTDPKPLDVRATILEGVGHDAWDPTYDLSAGHDVFAWLLSHEHP